VLIVVPGYDARHFRYPRIVTCHSSLEFCGVGDPCHVIRITAATMITQVTTL
jgi:hypothetical protein